MRILKSENKLIIKKAAIDETDIIYNFIKMLADYEKLSDEFTATPEQLKKTIFGPNSNVGTIIGYYENKPVAFALYFFNYSTFKGKRGLFLEDLFVLPEMRGKGFGKDMLKHLAATALENDCARFEWSVLDWNKPAIDFYLNLGAVKMDDWTVYRLNENEIKHLAAL